MFMLMLQSYKLFFNFDNFYEIVFYFIKKRADICQSSR